MQRTNQNVKYHCGDVGCGRIGSTFLSMRKNWQLIDPASCTKRQENFYNMAEKVAKDLAGCLENFDMTRFLDAEYPHVLQMSRWELEVMAMGIIRGWVMSPEKARLLNAHDDKDKSMELSGRVGRLILRIKFHQPAEASPDKMADRLGERSAGRTTARGRGHSPSH